MWVSVKVDTRVTTTVFAALWASTHQRVRSTSDPVTHNRHTASSMLASSPSSIGQTLNIHTKSYKEFISYTLFSTQSLFHALRDQLTAGS